MGLWPLIKNPLKNTILILKARLGGIQGAMPSISPVKPQHAMSNIPVTCSASLQAEGNNFLHIC